MVPSSNYRLTMAQPPLHLITSVIRDPVAAAIKSLQHVSQEACEGFHTYLHRIDTIFESVSDMTSGFSYESTTLSGVTVKKSNTSARKIFLSSCMRDAPSLP